MDGFERRSLMDDRPRGMRFRQDASIPAWFSTAWGDTLSVYRYTNNTGPKPTIRNDLL